MTQDHPSVVQKRLAVIQLADELGSVAEACRRSGMDRASFYVWKRRYDRDGLAGLADRPPIHKSHPQTTADEIANLITKLALQHPSYGCDRIAALLPKQSPALSAVTVQKILNRAALGTKQDRWLGLDAAPGAPFKKLTTEQKAFVLARNPCNRERDSTGQYPGEVLAVGIFLLGTVPGLGRIYVHAAVDTFSNLACALLHPTRQAAVMESTLWDVRHQLKPLGGMDGRAVITGSDPTLHGPAYNPFVAFLVIASLKHLTLRQSHSPGFIERLRRVLVAEFKPRLAAEPPPSLEDAQARLLLWLDQYNRHQANMGFPCFGHTPWDVASRYVRKEA